METATDIPSSSIEKQEVLTHDSLTPSQLPNLQNHNKSSSQYRIWIGIIIFICIVGITGWLFIKNTTQQQTSQQPQVMQNTNEKGILHIGENIDEDGLEADRKEFQPFIDYLVANLHQYGYTKGEFVGTHSVSELAELVREGKIDIVIDSAFPVYVVDKLADTQVIADRWKGGVGTYHSAIFVKKDSPIQTLTDLKGKMLAFDSNTSTVGYFLPKAELIKEGYTLTQKVNPKDSCPIDQICYIFTHGNVYSNVEKGIVPAGAESEIEIDNYFGNNISRYRIISKSPDILRFLVATRANLNPSLVKTIKNVLFTMDTSSQGRSVLKSFADTAKFTPVANNDASYGVIKDLTDLVEDEIVKE